MRTVSAFLVAVILAAVFAVGPASAAPVSAAEPQPITVVTYDVEQTPMSGFGCWYHTYDGTIVDTGRTVSGFVVCPSDDNNHLANYSGGRGTLNDDVIATTDPNGPILGDQLLLHSMNADDGLPIKPVITLHLDGSFLVTGIKIYGGDLEYNIAPGLLTGATVEIGGSSVALDSIPFGAPTALGIPANDLLDLTGTSLSGIATSTIVLRDFTSEFYGSPFYYSAISEIVVMGTKDAATLLSELRAQVSAVAPGSALEDKIAHAEATFANGRMKPTCNSLSDFTDLVRAQTGKKVDRSTAESWITQASAIEALLGC